MSDAVLDACLKQDPKSKMACGECLCVCVCVCVCACHVGSWKPGGCGLVCVCGAGDQVGVVLCGKS